MTTINIILRDMYKQRKQFSQKIHRNLGSDGGRLE